jgi:uncharacterized protein (TIGR02186 family)
MVKRFLFSMAFALFASAPVTAQQPQSPGDVAADLPAGVAEDQISVSSTYGGSHITVFGVNPDRLGRGDIVVVVRGPNQAVTVMRKRQVLGLGPFGLWVNGDPVRFSGAPSFFAVLSNKPLSEIANAQSIWLYRLDPAASAELASGVPAGADPSAYRRALVRLRRDQNLYQWHTQPPPQGSREGLKTYQRGLFRAVVRLPANAPISRYTADTYLFRDGRLISRQSIVITVSRIGFERTIHDLATRVSWLYGVVVVMIALAAGWGAALVFRRP